MIKATISLLSSITIFSISFTLSATTAPGNAWRKAGITPAGSPENSGIFDDLSSLVFLIKSAALIWTLVFLVLAINKLSVSKSNSQKRTAAFIDLRKASIGIWVILIAYLFAR